MGRLYDTWLSPSRAEQSVREWLPPPPLNSGHQVNLPGANPSPGASVQTTIPSSLLVQVGTSLASWNRIPVFVFSVYILLSQLKVETWNKECQ